MQDLVSTEDKRVYVHENSCLVFSNSLLLTLFRVKRNVLLGVINE